MMTKVLVIQPVLSAYRVPFYERAVPLLAQRGFDLTVAYGTASEQFSQRGDSAEIACGAAVPTRLVGSGVQPWALRRWQDLTPDPDLVIVQQTVKALETYPLLVRQRLRGRPGVAMWGHGRSYSTPQGRAAAACKQWLTRRCEWFFAYTQGGADHVIAKGFPSTRVTVLNNTIDTDSLRTQLDCVGDADVAAYRVQHGLTAGMTALFLGGVDDAKGFSFLMSATSEAQRMLPDFRLLVAGDGERRGDAETVQAAGGPIRVLGRVEGREKALALRAADALAIPEWIGLVAIDSFLAGRPIVSTTHHSHSPEAEYLSPDITAWFGEHDPQSYAAALTGLLTNPARLASMQEACEAEQRNYPMSRMVEAFVDGVVSWDEVRRSGL